MEQRIGPLTFFSNFDSGNLAKVERKLDDENSEDENTSVPTLVVPDYEFNVWTSPDAVGTEFENLNRTWFHFGVKGGSPGKLIKINIMNLNRQGKLYTQGMSPFVKVVPGRNKWERIRERPTHETVDGQFILSFTYRFPEQKNTVHYFAFCYPYSYSELQTLLQSLDKKYDSCKKMTPLSPSSSIYYHRELLCKSLDDLRMDLLTITSSKGMMEERETRLDKLFPDVDIPRARRFRGKKVYFLSARVHPGETPSSFVFNGFLDFILRQDDPRSVVLRDQYVFKLIPMLNPDGVKRGHYRTDSRGVNLNRVYLEPDPVLHPTIYAAKSLIMYHHNKVDLQTKNRVCSCGGIKNDLRRTTMIVEKGKKTLTSLTKSLSLDEGNAKEVGKRLPPEGEENVKEVRKIPDDTITVVSAGSQDFENSANEIKNVTNANIENKLESLGFLDRSNLNDTEGNVKLESTSEDNKLEDETKGISKVSKNKLTCNCLAAAENEMKMSGDLEYYVDLHGHASKRGCFVYANYMENEEDYLQSILYPKLMSINSANFDFTGCNFTEKNMYTKDKRDGMSKEGSGRVAVFKATSIVHSYTLECNYNSGRMLNPVPPATCDNGRATPPPPPGFPPKFTTEIYEEVGRALAVAVLDVNNSNPWSRLPTSEFGSVEGVKNWVQRFVKSAKNAPTVPKKLSRAAAKTSSIVAGATASTRQKYCSAYKSSSSNDLSCSETLSAAAQKITERMTQNINAPKKVLEDPKVSKRIIAAPKQLSQTISGLPSNRLVSTITRKKYTPGLNVDNQSLTAATNGSLRTIHKNKEQSRVSLDLPRTGPALRIPKPNQLLSANIKALSCPGDLRTGRSKQVEVHNQFVGLQPRKISVIKPGGGSASDEEKRKKITLSKKKNGKKKGKSDELVNGLPASSTPDTKQQKSSDMDIVTKKRNGSARKGESTGSSLLQRSCSSKKKMIDSSLNSCEVVDITELPQSCSQPLAYWVDV